MFSPNTLQRFKRFLKSIIGTPSADELGAYLGNNIEVDGRSSSKFQYLTEKLQKKIGDWKRLTLSHAGRALFINAILASMCQHVLSVFLLPKKTADSISKLFASFLWENNSERKPVFWRSRGIIELPKGMGGMGIRNVRAFNMALLANQVLRIHERKDTLVFKLLISKYKQSPVT